MQRFLQTDLDACQGTSNLARYESLTAHRGFVIEQDAVAGEKPIRLAVIHRDPISINLGGPIRRARVEGCRLPLRDFLNLAEHFGSGRLVEPRLAVEPQNTDGFEHSQRAQ